MYLDTYRKQFGIRKPPVFQLPRTLISPVGEKKAKPGCRRKVEVLHLHTYHTNEQATMECYTYVGMPKLGIKRKKKKTRVVNLAE
jgi:hypothetical protein